MPSLGRSDLLQNAVAIGSCRNRKMRGSGKAEPSYGVVAVWTLLYSSTVPNGAVQLQYSAVVTHAYALSNASIA